MSEKRTYEVGQSWVMKVSNQLTVVRLTYIGVKPGYYNPATRRSTPIRWQAEGVNTATGKKVHIKSTQKLRYLVCEKCQRPMTRCACTAPIDTRGIVGTP